MPVLDNYVFNDGRTNYLMSLSGTIPVMFKDTSYNIPVCLWLDESYPQTAPICYVKPTKDMVTVRGKHVDSNGEVMLPFLQEWSQETAQETAQASCSLQFYRQAEGLDEDAQLFLTTEDDQPFHQDNETNC
ncbi:unnamed protein product [Arctogadus glacialis]